MGVSLNCIDVYAVLERANEEQLHVFATKHEFQKLNWLPMNTHFQVRENITTFKSLTGNSPKYLTKLFHRCSNETYNLRSNYDQLSLEKPNTNFLKKSFSYRAAKSWNNLPPTLTQNIGNKTVHECI